MVNLYLLLWAVIPPLLLLWLYYLRTPLAPPIFRVLLFFILGAVSGFAALGIEWVEEFLGSRSLLVVPQEYLGNWQQWWQSLPGVFLQQLLEISSIEEGCKFAALIIPIYYLQRKYKLRATSVFLFAIAVALGFTAQENGIYLFHGVSSILARTVSTPVHAMFSVPWGYALAIYLGASLPLDRDRQLIPAAWLNSVICHATANTLSIACVYPLPIRLLGYGLFPFLLWMFWRLEQLMRRVKGKHPPLLIWGDTLPQRSRRRVLVLLSLFLGGNSLAVLFLLARQVSYLKPDSPMPLDLLSQLLLSLGLGILAWWIYRHLRQLSRDGAFKSNQQL